MSDENQLKSRDSILGRIKQSLQQKVELPFNEEYESPYKSPFGENGNVTSRFSCEFTSHKGTILMSKGKEELLGQLQALVVAKNWQKIACKNNNLKKILQSASFPIGDETDGDKVEVGITDCEYLVARTGSVLFSSAQNSGRIFPIHVPVLLVIAKKSQLVNDIGNALNGIRKKYGKQLPSAMFFVSGPSSTGDIERIIVNGVHGPMDMYVFMIDQEIF